MDGGSGVDYVLYDTAGRGVNVNLATKRASGQGADRFLKVEGALGSRHGDVLRGNGLSNTLFGLGGNDKLFGGGGRDGLYGAAGKDRLDGGPGRDITDGGAGNDNCLNGEVRYSC
jgi:Ca2+-binding RTX toxin-like protein